VAVARDSGCRAGIDRIRPVSDTHRLGLAGTRRADWGRSTLPAPAAALAAVMVAAAAARLRPRHLRSGSPERRQQQVHQVSCEAVPI